MLYLWWLLSHSGLRPKLEHSHKATKCFFPLHCLSPYRWAWGSIVYLPFDCLYRKLLRPQLQRFLRCILCHCSLDTFGTVKIHKRFLGFLPGKMLECKDALWVTLGLYTSKMGAILKCKLGCPVPSGGGCVTAYQACLFDGVHCALLMGEFCAVGTFFLWADMEAFSCMRAPLELVVGLPNYSFDTPLFPDIQSVCSPTRHALRLQDSWRSSTSTKRMTVQDLPKRFPLKLSYLELRVTSKGF